MENSSVSRRGSVTVDGVRLRYVVEGSGIPALVPGSAVYYPRTFSQRLRDSCRLAFADLRHFAPRGGSADPETTSLDTYARDIERLRAEVGFERCALIGHSHHGNLALEYAKRYPQNVSHLVLIGTPPCDVQTTVEGGRRYWEEHASAARKEIFRNNQSALRADDLASMPADRALVARYVADGSKYWYDPAFDASSLWQGVPVNMDIIPQFKGFFADYAFALEAVSTRTPVLVVMGRHDYVVPHWLWDEVLPQENVTYHLLERSGHTPHLEQPVVFDQLLLEWLKRIPGAPLPSDAAV